MVRRHLRPPQGSLISAPRFERIVAILWSDTHLAKEVFKHEVEQQRSAELYSTSGCLRQQSNEHRQDHLKAASPQTQSQIIHNHHHGSEEEDNARFREYNPANTAYRSRCTTLSKPQIRPSTADPLQSSKMTSSLTRTVTVPFSRQVSDVDLSDASSCQQHQYGNKQTDAASYVQHPRESKPTARSGSGVGGLRAGKATPAFYNESTSGESSSEEWQQWPLLSQSCRFIRNKTMKEHAANLQGLRRGSDDDVSMQDEPQLVSNRQLRMSAHRPKRRCSSSGNSRYVQCKDDLYYKISAVPSKRILLPTQRSRSARHSAVSVASRPFTQHSNPEFQMKDHELFRHDYSNNCLFEGSTLTESSDGY